MEQVVYPVYRGINKSIEFKGLKAQYIWWLAMGMVVLLIMYAGMHVWGINDLISLGAILTAGAVLVLYVYRLSARYGQYGMMKQMASRQTPAVIICRSRKIFIQGI